MMRREIIEDGVRLYAMPFAASSPHARCRVAAEVTVRLGSYKRNTKIFIAGLDTVRGLSISDTVLLMNTVRKVMAEAASIVEEGKATQPKTKAHMKAISAADQENARVREERRRSRDGMTKSERAMSQSGRKKCKKSKRSK